MKSIRLFGVILVVGFVYARLDRARGSDSRADCGSTCTTSNDRSEPFVTKNPLVINDYQPKDEYRVYTRQPTTPVFSLTSVSVVSRQDLLRRDPTIVNKVFTDLYTKAGAAKSNLFDIPLLPDDIVDAITPRSPAENKALEGGAELQILFCSGKDLKSKDIAGVCTDGNFLWYTSDDCSKKCKCGDDGKMSCDIPSDCGPQKDVVEYCASNPSFSCTCLTNRENNRAIERQQYSMTPISTPTVEATKTESADPLVTTNSAEENAGSEKERSELAGVPLIPVCILDWTCWDPPTWLTQGQQLATTLTTLTTTQAPSNSK